MVTIDGTEISGATIDGEDVSEITVDGDVVWTAIPDSPIESFEDDDLSDYDNGDIYSTSSDQSYEGDRSLVITNDEDGSTNPPPLYSNSGLEMYPEQGYKFSLATYKTDDNTNWYFYFGISDTPSDSYALRRSNDDFALVKYESGSSSNLATTTDSYYIDTWVYHEVSWTTSGEITWEWYDGENLQDSLSDTDTTYTSGGIGFESSSNAGSQRYFDAITIEEAL